MLCVLFATRPLPSLNPLNIKSVFVFSFRNGSIRKHHQHGDRGQVRNTHKMYFYIHFIPRENKRVSANLFFLLRSPFDRNLSLPHAPIRSLSFRFEEQHSCQSWFDHLKRALSKWRETPRRPPPPPPNRSSTRKSLYPQIEPESRGSVPPAIERCISHITAHGGFVRSFCLCFCLPAGHPYD